MRPFGKRSKGNVSYRTIQARIVGQEGPDRFAIATETANGGPFVHYRTQLIYVIADWLRPRLIFLLFLIPQ
jgi:formylmethanofuran dehydrogenase subunit A